MNKSDNFIEYLIQLSQNENKTKILSDLKHGLRTEPGNDIKMYPYIVSWTQNLFYKEEYIYYMTASLFAYYPEHTEEDINIGHIYKEIYKSENSKSIEKRLIALLNSDLDNIQPKLRSLVGLAKNKKIKINWKNFMKDLLYWDHESNFSKKKIASSFYNK